MRLKKIILKGIVLFVAMCLTITASADVAYIYLRSGLNTCVFNVENDCPLGYPYDSTIAAWNDSAAADVVITTVASSSNYIITGQYGTDWYGLYTPKNINIFTGRAGHFTIKINRDVLVGEDTNFRQSVMVHEFGHVLSLDDNPSPSNNNSSIMNNNRDRDILYWPTTNDVYGVNDVYK